MLIAVAVLITLCLLLFAFVIYPYYKARKVLYNKGYKVIKKGFLKFYYSGVFHLELEPYNKIERFLGSNGLDVESLIVYQRERSENSGCYLHNHPGEKKVLIFIVVSACVFICLNLFEESISWPKWLIYPGDLFLVWYILVPMICGGLKLRKHGFRKDSFVLGIVLFYSGGYFLPLPQHSDIVAIPSYKEDDINTLLSIQIIYYQSKNRSKIEDKR